MAFRVFRARTINTCVESTGPVTSALANRSDRQEKHAATDTNRNVIREDRPRKLTGQVAKQADARDLKSRAP